MPSDGLWGDGSLYLPHHGQDFESWIVEDVPEVTRLVVPEVGSRSPVFIAGLSMGGFAALRLGARYPDVFAGMSGLSSVTDLSQLAGLVEEDHASLGIPSSDRSLREVMRSSRKIHPFRFDCGREDFLIEANRELHRDLMEAGVPHQYEESSGIHDWSYWRTSFEATLRFFASLC